MFDGHFPLLDIRIEVIETADKYMKAVLINTKKRYFRILVDDIGRRSMT